MKYIQFIGIALLLFTCKNAKTFAASKPLTIIEQNYSKALETASKENKLILIDFYTTWCAPCKKLDRLVFQNDSIQQILEQDFILLKYDAENDTIFHLSKKHHVRSYPTGLVLNKEGYVLNRKYGFRGEDFESLSQDVLKFTNESLELDKSNRVLKGYSKQIDLSAYPVFYVDYVNRTNIKVSTTELNNYWTTNEDIFSEVYFSTLLYFAEKASDTIANNMLKNRRKYLDLYGDTDVEVLLYFLTSGKFNRAVAENNQQKYDEAIQFAKEALSKKWTDDIIPRFEKDFLVAQGKWNQVFEINERLKNEDSFSNGAINQFCWDVYKKCNDPEIIRKCLAWMKEVTDKEPTYLYLDTYAFLMYKSGDKVETKKIAQQAIEVAKKENEKTNSLEKLLREL